MLKSYSVIRRYTPPTCTLHLLTKRSWLRRKSVVDALRFELQFDDPRSPEANQVMLQGDRAQLELLSNVVKRYVQQFLQSSSLYHLSRAVTPVDSSTALNRSVPAPELSRFTTSDPYVQPQGLLSHQLFLGSLAASKDAIELSTLQLFDLANALEASQIDIAALPLEQARTRRQTLAWAGGTVALLLAVGIPVGIELWQSDEPQDVALQEIETEPLPADEPAVVPPVPPPPDSTLIPAPSLPPALDNERLLPPPPVQSPPSASLPTPPSKPVPPAAPPKTAITVKPNVPKSSSSPAPTTSAAPRANPNVAPQLPNLPTLQPRPTQAPPTSATKPPEDGAPTGDVAPKALLDDIPQVAEVRQYFQQQWQPPENLSQTLEYRLVLNRDGSIGRIIPLGKASEVYLDRTGMPLMGESFVSALPEEANAQVRVVLNPDGTVQTFLESS